jgi:hypothetical protein
MKNKGVLSVFAFILVVFFIITAILIHFLKHNLDAAFYPLSLYAIGKYGGILIAGLLAIGLAEMLISLSLYHKNSVLSRVSAICLFIAGIGAMMVAVFKMDYTGIRTITGSFHLLGAAVQFVFFPAAVFLYSFNMKNRVMKSYSRITGAATFILLIAIAFILILEMTEEIGIYGLIQKTDILFISAWLLVAALYRE